MKVDNTGFRGEFRDDSWRFMEILAKVVNGSKIIIKLIWQGFYEDVKSLFVWTLGLVIRLIHLIWKLKNICFVPWDHLDFDLLDLGWKQDSFNHLYKSNHSFSICSIFSKHLICFTHHFRNSMSMEFRHKDKLSGKNPKPIVTYINGLSDCCNQLLNGWISCITEANLFGYRFLESLGSTDHWSIFQNK